MARRDVSDAPVFTPVQQPEPCRNVREMDRRIDVTFDEGPDSFQGIAGTIRPQFLLRGSEAGLHLPEGPE